MPTSASLTFLGGVGTVTGSRFLVATGAGSQVLVDCGLFQGLRELRRRNWEPFPVAAAGIDAVVLTHAHLDHSGYLPALAHAGFTGPVLATEGTRRLAQVVLRDSAHLLAEDAEHARTFGYAKHHPPLPLYTEADVELVGGLFRSTPYREPVAAAGEVMVTLRPGGHILGSATAAVELAAGPTLLFSGDLGRPAHPLLAPPDPPPRADVVVVESTYGDRRHEPEDDHRLAEVIVRTVHRGGSVVIPAFAVDRTEVILMALSRLQRQDAIPPVPIYVDSPMALDSLRIYRDAVRAGDPEIRPDLDLDRDLAPVGLHEVRSASESKTLNQPRWPCVLISASGMATGGRVLHHLEAALPDPRNSVVLAGYQAVGTRGRSLLDGAATVKMHGRAVPVRAEVVDLPMFSVHADADELLGWLARSPAAPAACYVVHGEPAAAEALRRRIGDELGWAASVPQLGERVPLPAPPG